MEHPMKKAENLARKERYNEAFAILANEEHKGNPMASYALGTWYLHGTHVKKDLKRGFHFLNIAAKGDIKDAFFDLGICYEKGAGTEKNRLKAFDCYMKASQLGNKHALYEVFRCLYWGHWYGEK